MNKIKRYFLKLWYSLPFAMKGGNDEIFGTSISHGEGVSINQETNDKRVSKHLIKGEVTQEVEELRYRTYKVAEESEKMVYLGGGVAVKREEKPETRKIHKFVQPNDELTITMLEAMGKFEGEGDAVSDPTGIVRHRLEFTYNTFLRFNLENFVEEVAVYMNEETGVAETTFIFSSRPDPYDMKSMPFINELKKMASLKTPYEIERNDFASGIDSLLFVTFKASGEDNMVTYAFSGGAKFKSYQEDKSCIKVTYTWETFARVKENLSDKYYSESMDAKYRKNEKRDSVYQIVDTERKRYCELCGKEISTVDGDILEATGNKVLCPDCFKEFLKAKNERNDD